MITREKLIKEYVDHFKSHDHKHIPSSSLIPENDPTVLFTTAGMHPLVPFIAGQKHPLGTRLVNVQKCIRTGDIEEVGDTTHHTFFEMLGNWSLGDYWKEDAITMTYEFLTKKLNIPLEKLAFTCFGGDDDAPKDEESATIWKSLGVPESRIAYLGKNDNWWGPAGETGPCGPDTEVFYWSDTQVAAPETFDPNDDRWVEIGNNVLMQYEKTKAGKYIPLKQKVVDFGGGVERMLTVLNGFDDNYESPLFKPIIEHIEKLSGKNYSNTEYTRSMRIIADHIKAATFILGDARGVAPSNVGQGYVLRRLIRRAIRHARMLNIEEQWTAHLAKTVVSLYPEYQELSQQHTFIHDNLDAEETKFKSTLEKGLKEFEKIATDSVITGTEAFLLFQSYGFPIEMTQELAAERGLTVDLEAYNEEFKKHQDLSRQTTSGTFKSGLADNSDATKKLHTATHLLNEALRQVLGDDVKQRGSNITPERLRFDFSFDRKLTDEEKQKIEQLVNAMIDAGLKITREEVPLSQALDAGAQAEFGNKYPEMVSVYTMHDDSSRGWFSKEICTGPHVANTKELGHFRIKKEQSSAAGVRRIKAVLE